MAYAITQNCCTDASCVAACPVNCIHPTPDEPDFGTTDMLYVDPRTCIDCGACADACPVDAVRPVELLTGALADYPALNAGFFADRPIGRPATAGPVFHAWGPPSFPVLPPGFPVLDVAVVGTGPAGMYTVQELLLHTTARITLYDRLDIAGGLVRFGVAPDHPATKKIGETFARLRGHERVRLRLGVEVGRDVTIAELDARHDAVIVAVGASRGRELGVPGEDLPGVLSATTVVGWYNGHPEIGPDAVDLSARDGRAQRVVVVGNGNVALDVARILTADPPHRAVPQPVLDRLRSSCVREVVVLGRRGPDAAAYTRPELLALARRAGVELIVDDADPATGAAIDAAADGEHAAVLHGVRRERIDWSAAPASRRVVLRFGSAPTAFLGDGRVQLVRTAGADIPAGLVVRAIGHRGTAVPGLPFDEAAGVVPHSQGRVEGMPGVYVVGWIKRGASGGIGANRTDAAETVAALVDDVVTGRMPPRTARRPARSRAGSR